MNKYVAYIVGDENIELGALVALHSFNKRNPNIDLKLYTYEAKISKIIKLELDKINVEIIDIGLYLSKVDVFQMHSDKELAWPKEVFINYYIPHMLGETYEYSIKLDYDLFCCNTIPFDDIIPERRVLLSSVYNPFNLRKMLKGSFGFYKEHYGLYNNYAKKIGINTGFIIFNNLAYKEYDIFNNMKMLYLEIKRLDKNAFDRIYADQGLLTTLIAVDSIPYKIIDDGYNVTTKIFQALDKDAKIYNLHFTGKIKPWKKTITNDEELYGDSYSNTIMAIYWNKYVDENLSSIKDLYESDSVEEVLNIFSQIIQNKKITQIKYEALYNKINGSRYHKVIKNILN